MSASQPITITNNGTTGTTVNTITVDPPFQLSGFPHSQVLQPGKFLTVNVNLDGTIPANYNNMLTVGFNNVLSKGTALKGSVTAGNALGVSIYPQLPSGVVTGAYLSNLTAAGGVPPYSWQPPIWFQFTSGTIAIVRRSNHRNSGSQRDDWQL